MPTGLALSVTAIVVLRASAWQVGVITALGSSAYLLIGLPAGVWVDRWRKRPVLVTADVVRALAMASVPVAHLGGWLTVAHLMVVAAVMSFSMVFSDTAQTAFVPRIVGAENVSEATARLQSTDTTMRVVGPGLAALLLARMAAPYLYVVSAVAAAASALTISRMKAPEPVSAGRDHEPFWTAVRSGIGFVVTHPALRVLMSSAAFINLGAGVFAALATLIALDDFEVPPEQFGLAVSVAGAGGIVGALVGLRVKRALGEIRTVLACYCCLPLAALILPLGYVAPAPEVLFVALSDFFFGLIVVTSSISSTGLRARVTPLDMMGRVSSASRFVTLGALPLGALVGGGLGEALSHGQAVLVAPLSMAVAAVLFLTSPLRRHRDLPEDWKAQQADRS